MSFFHRKSVCKTSIPALCIILLKYKLIIISNYFAFCQGSDDRLPVWYVMDEFGSRIQHSDNPTVRTAPFMYAPTQMAYTIMWPIQDIDYEGTIS